MSQELCEWFANWFAANADGNRVLFYVDCTALFLAVSEETEKELIEEHAPLYVARSSDGFYVCFLMESVLGYADEEWNEFGEKLHERFGLFVNDNRWSDHNTAESFMELQRRGTL